MIQSHLRHLVSAYAYARSVVVDAGYLWEMEWQASRDFSRITTDAFLREASWVILASGMRETVIREKFPRIASAFMDWRCPTRIISHATQCKRAALKIFGHEPKINAILTFIAKVEQDGFDQVVADLRCDPIAYIRTFPYMGPATSYHLAKNLGLDVAKPDRHLVRIANASGCHSVDVLCAIIADFVGERINVVDIVLWRYATIDKHYAELFCKRPAVCRNSAALRAAA